MSGFRDDTSEIETDRTSRRFRRPTNKDPPASSLYCRPWADTKLTSAPTAAEPIAITASRRLRRRIELTHKKPSQRAQIMKLPRFAQARARRLVESPQELLRVVAEARCKQGAPRTARRLTRVLGELKTMLQLMQAWAGGAYSGVSKVNLVLIVGAVVYFLMPTDLIPDFIAGVGLLDDAAVIAWVVDAVRDELAKFKAWRLTDE